jgi:hypothetical protein
MASEPKRQTVNFEELAFSNMMTLNALVELLDEKGVLTREEVLIRIRLLRARADKKPN